MTHGHLPVTTLANTSNAARHAILLIQKRSGYEPINWAVSGGALVATIEALCPTGRKVYQRYLRWLIEPE